jgi:hypothetical protein
MGTEKTLEFLGLDLETARANSVVATAENAEAGV